MAATAARPLPHIPVGEYLGSVYRPDVDYVDGEIEERNAGEIDHAILQKMILLALAGLEEQLNIFALQEVRVQINATRFRIPDICVIPADSIPEKIVTQAPLLCVEVLSPRDSVMSMRQRCMDYIRMGVPEIWIFDPAAETAYVMRSEQLEQRSHEVLAVGDTGIRLDMDAMFEAARKRTRR